MAIEKVINITANTQQASDSIKKLSGDLQENANKAFETSGVFKILDSQTGGAASQMLSLGKSLVSTVKGFELSSLAAKGFRVALISTGIGAIVVALGGLIAAFASTQRGIDAVTSVTRPLKAVFDTLIGVSQQLGFILVDLFTKPQQAIKDLKDLASNIFSGKLFTEAIEQGKEIDRLTKQLSKSEGDYILNVAKAKDEFKELNKLAEDVTKPIKEREAAAVKSIEVQKRINKLASDRLDLEIKLLKEKQKQNDTSDEEEKQLKELEAKKLEFNAAANEAITTQNNKVNSIRKEQESKDAAAAKERSDKEKARIQEVNALRIKLLDNLAVQEAKTEAQKIELERAKAQEELNNLKATTKERAELQTALNRFYENKERERKKADAAKVKEEEEKDAETALNKSVERTVRLASILKSIQKQTESEKLEEEKAKKIQELAEIKAEEEAALIASKASNDAILANREAFEKNKAALTKFYDDKIFEEKRKDEEKEREAREAFEQAKINILTSGLNLLSEVAGKSKAIATATLLVEKGLAISQVVSQAAKSIAIAKANLLAVPAVLPGTALPNPLYPKAVATTAKGVATTKIQAGISIASILAQTVGKLGGAGNIGGASGGGDTGGGTPSAPSAPSFNIVQGSASNQIATSLQNRTPIQAFVVSSNVTTAQSLDRNIVQSARL
jgi:hypothetical protein